jgi:S1-C subfamily serine protease
MKGSPADNAGLKEGDVIISLADQTIATVDDIHKLLTKERIGKEFSIELLRDWTQTLKARIIPDRSQE